jgi:hypothetical protein
MIMGQIWGRFLIEPGLNPPRNEDRRREVRNIVGWLLTALVLIGVVFAVGLAAGDKPLEPVPLQERGYGYPESLSSDRAEGHIVVSSAGVRGHG